MGSTPEIHQTDVVICGSGSAGLMAALWLARYGVNFRVLEQRNGPLVRGQADGVQCRTVEIFESFGLSDQLLRESYHLMELVIWAPDPGTALAGDERGGGIKRSHCGPELKPGLSHHPHVILNQARINEMITEEMLRCGGPEIDYGFNVQHVEVNSSRAEDANAYPVTVTALKDGVHHTFHAKYTLGCDGAHSMVRRALGFEMLGDSTDAVWGVMDLYPRTTFPDIRKKAVIQSASGTLIIIPREGDFLVRFYIELPPDTVASQVTLADLHERARLIFRPYEMEMPETTWWSAYAIGQRLATHFHEQYRVFLTGDACHTHSPKAGQGMNVSLQDGYNIGWKLGAYLTGQASAALLETYVSERQNTAAELIEFDRNWSKIFKTSGGGQHGDGGAVSGAYYVRDQYIKSGRYTAGQAYKYGKSIIVWPPQNLPAADRVAETKRATDLVVGMRFPSAQVVRWSDAKVFQLLSTLKSDRRWRIVVFAGDIHQESLRRPLEEVAESIKSIVKIFTPEEDDQDSVIESLLVLKTKRTEIELYQIPEIFKPETGRHHAQDLHKVFVDDESYHTGHGRAFDILGLDPDTITVVAIRPDQYISLIVSGEDVETLSPFFKGFLRIRA